MALEWAPRGIRVNAVAPGHVATEGVIEDFRAGRLDEKAMLASIPARRIADVDDIADAVLFLCGDRARHIAGQVLTVDAGGRVLIIQGGRRRGDRGWPVTNVKSHSAEFSTWVALAFGAIAVAICAVYSSSLWVLIPAGLVGGAFGWWVERIARGYVERALARRRSR